MLFDIKRFISNKEIDEVVIEMVASYGMPVGETVFQTCVAIGQFKEKALENAIVPYFIYRKDEKMNICNSMKAKDSNIRQALIDRFGEVGTKKEPGWFYGFKADIWQAYAVRSYVSRYGKRKDRKMKDVKFYDKNIEKQKERIVEVIAIATAFLIGFFAGCFIKNKYDVNGDGKVTSADYVLIKNYIMNGGNDDEDR